MQYHSFKEFYPYYLSEHSNVTCRQLHFVGSSAGLVCLGLAAFYANPWFIFAGIFVGYLCAWIGHFFYEHNKPATFQYPFYSFAGDWVMFWQILTGKLAISAKD